MAQHTRHPIAAPPQAPARESSRRLLLRAHAIVLIAVTMAMPALYHAFGLEISAAVVLVLFAATLAWWVPRIVARRNTDPFPWRRLPWASLGYVTWAALSIVWSAWRGVSLTTWAGLVIVTVSGLFLASTLSWRELVKVLASALKWVVGLSFLFELFVSVVIRHPIFPAFVTAPTGDVDPQLYWSRDNLLSGGRIQGLVGNANLFAMICLIALLVFAVRLAGKASRRGWLVAWIVLTGYLFFRAASATAWLALLAAAVVLLAVLAMRSARTPTGRTVRYTVFFTVGALAVAGGVVLREAIFTALGKSGDLTGRGEIWAEVWQRAAAHPVIGWGFASPWVPFDAAFDGWIVDHGQSVMQAHNTWLDVFFQLGAVGVILIAVVYDALLWRAWFFAVDRPRWDVDARRPFTALSVLPILIVTVLLVQSLTESNPAMLWGWMFVVMFSFKIKSAPVVGLGVAEQTVERGRPAKRRR